MLYTIDRQLGRFGDRTEMAQHAVLRRLVVVGDDGEDPIDAALRGFARQLDGMMRVVRARTRDHRRAVSERLFHDFEQPQLFVVLERRRFAGRPANDDAVVPDFDQMLRETRRPRRSRPLRRGGRA